MLAPLLDEPVMLFDEGALVTDNSYKEKLENICNTWVEWVDQVCQSLKIGSTSSVQNKKH